MSTSMLLFFDILLNHIQQICLFQSSIHRIKMMFVSTRTAFQYYWQSSTNATELSSTRTVPLITSALSLAAKCIGEYIGVLFENIFIIFMEIRSNRYSRLLDSGLFVSVNLIGALLSVRVRNRSIKERNKIIPGGF
eukprot:953391_1